MPILLCFLILIELSSDICRRRIYCKNAKRFCFFHRWILIEKTPATSSISLNIPFTMGFHNINKRKYIMYRENRGRGGFNRGPREMHKVTCAECGKETEVPFKPDGTRPVYCRDCYQKHRPKRF